MIRHFGRLAGVGAVVLLSGALMLTVAPAGAQTGGPGIVEVQTAGSVPDVVAHLKKMIAQNGMMVMGNLNQGKVLSMTGLNVQSETLFVGNPQVGKQLFSTDPGVGLVVPVRVNVYRDKQGHTTANYLPPSTLLKDYGSPEVDKVAQMLDTKLQKMVQMLGS